MITATSLIYYGVCAVLIVAGVWFLVKCPLFPKDDEVNGIFWEE